MNFVRTVCMTPNLTYVHAGWLSGADLGFPRRALIPKGGASLLFRQILLKLHENEENWTGDASKIFHVDPPLVVVCIQKWIFNLEI